MKDLTKTEEIHEFSEESQKLITDMNNTEIFELCDTFSMKQCPSCALYWLIGIVYCSCGRSLKFSQELDKNKYGATSIPRLRHFKGL